MAEIPSPVPLAHEVAHMGPTELAHAGASRGVEAASAGIGNVMHGAISAAPLALLGFTMWWGMDMIMGGALGNPLTSHSARHVA